MPIHKLILPLLLSACLVNEDLYGQRIVSLRDDDGDGYGEDDCDDNDPTRHPGADELCDGEDDNCNGTIDEGAIDRIWYLDADGDGFANPNAPQVSCSPPGPEYHLDALDCDDEDPEVNPNAIEACDGRDNNCDGVVDEEPTLDAPTWYLDADTDGYGDPAGGIRACVAPTDRHVTRPGDCDDTNSTIFPGAGELCDGIDQDCDGHIDDAPLVDPEAWYPDDDGDSYGDGDSPIASCGMGEGFVQDNTDCDDSRDSVHPGAVEICNNGLDDNCNDSPDGCVWPARTDLDDHTIISGVTSIDAAGYSGAVGDLDADGNPEAILGVAYASEIEGAPDYQGAVAIFEAPISPVSRPYTDANTLLTASGVTTRAGRSVLVSDIDGDHVDDLIIGGMGESTRANRAGIMFVLFGPFRGSMAIETAADWTLVGNLDTERIGDKLVSVGDISGDGVDDFAMSNTFGASSASVPDGGSVYLFTSAGAGEDVAREVATSWIYSDEMSDQIANGLAGLDLDGDGIQDLALGAPNAGDDEEGLTGLFFGPLGATQDFYDADILWAGVDGYDTFGYALAAGDMNADGIDDLVATATLEGSEDGAPGSAYLFFGSTSLSSTAGTLSAGDAEHKIRCDDPDVRTSSVSQIGDLNKDGFLDLGMSAANAIIYFGPFEGGVQLASTYDIKLAGNSSDGDSSMPFVLNGGDLFGDGGDDLFIGSPLYNGGESVSGYGRAFLVPGVSW